MNVPLHCVLLNCIELRGMLYDLLKHCVTGALDGQDVATFISELASIYVRGPTITCASIIIM